MYEKIDKWQQRCSYFTFCATRGCVGEMGLSCNSCLRCGYVYRLQRLSLRLGLRLDALSLRLVSLLRMLNAHVYLRRPF